MVGPSSSVINSVGYQPKQFLTREEYLRWLHSLILQQIVFLYWLLQLQLKVLHLNFRARSTLSQLIWADNYFWWLLQECQSQQMIFYYFKGQYDWHTYRSWVIGWAIQVPKDYSKHKYCSIAIKEIVVTYYNNFKKVKLYCLWGHWIFLGIQLVRYYYPWGRSIQCLN